MNYKIKTMLKMKVAFFILLFLTLPAHADYQTNLLPWGYIQDSAGDIDVGLFSVPVVYDWDSDGKKDLLLGQKYYRDSSGTIHGYVSFFQNTGADGAPSFDEPVLLEECSPVCSPIDVYASG
jgi:hypothetical protein